MTMKILKVGFLLFLNRGRLRRLNARRLTEEQRVQGQRICCHIWEAHADGSSSCGDRVRTQFDRMWTEKQELASYCNRRA